jgi:futalosine hydrolase
MDLLLLTATLFEQDLLRAQLSEPIYGELAGRSWVRGKLGQREVLLVETGMGAVNCTHALSCVLQAQMPAVVWQVGVGGAYADSGLAVGDVAVASQENYGDLGVRLDDGWQGLRHTIGIAILERGEQVYFNRFDLDAARAEQMAAQLNGSFKAAAGPFLTVQECTGTDELGTARSRRFGALCENMEGAAAAHICALYEVDFVELRAMSNIAAKRNRDEWELPLACRTAQEAALELIYSERF